MLVLGQILEGYVIYPRFLGDRVELPAVWVIFALFAGGAAFGFLGRDAGGPGRSHDRRAVPVLAAPVPGQSALPGPAAPRPDEPANVSSPFRFRTNPISTGGFS